MTPRSTAKEPLIVDGLTADGPGAALRQARERRGMTIASVADQLRLEMHVVDALEADDYAQLPAPIFVKGYIRSYGELVGLPTEPLWNAYKAIQKADAPPLVVDPSYTRLHHARQWLRWLLLLAGIFFMLALAWWYSQSEDLPVSTDDVLNGIEPAVEQSASAAPTEPDTRPVMPDLSNVPVAITPPEPAPAAPVPSDIVAEPTPDTANTPLAATDNTVADDVTTLAPVEPFVLEDGKISLYLDLIADSWVSIRDADGERLVNELLRANQLEEYYGRPPFKVVLGNSPAVTVWVDGSLFEHQQFQNGNVARFTIPVPDNAQ